MKYDKRASIRLIAISTVFGATFGVSGWAALPKGTWVADFGQASKGRVEFQAIGRPSALKIHGKGGAPHGQIKVDGSQVSGQISFKLDSLETGISLRDKHMKEKYLEADKYPEATLRISKIDPPGGALPPGDFKLERVPFSGDLTLHGKSNPVNGTASLVRSDKTVLVEAEFGLKISDYAIDIPSFAGITVANEVKVNVHSESVVEAKAM